jgi:hypothetical protein
MKKIFLFLVSLAILATCLVAADTIPPDSHLVNRCVKFVNLNTYPDVVLIGFYTGPMERPYTAYQIQDNTCLQKGYKFNAFKVYWTTKEKFDTLDLNNLRLGSTGQPTEGWDNITAADLTLLSADIEPFLGYITDSNPLVKETIEYSIAVSGGQVTLHKSKTTSEYNNGKPNKVETFNTPPPSNPTETPQNPTPSTTQSPEPSPADQNRGFWSKIGCFFTRLFGGSC